jgi:hypothetical protein
MEHETFLSLLKDPAHWEMELFLIFIFDIMIGAILLPCFRRATKHHKSDDQKIKDLENQVKMIRRKLGV